jgi:SAM-dependent methyltransferase
MNINAFDYDKCDISQYLDVVHQENESVLARSVNVINYNLCKKLKGNSNILEIGCGRSSFLKSNIDSTIKWYGLDVYKIDYSGRKSIATEIGSVHDTPYDSQMFDSILANQSLEHWFEYGVSIEEAMDEIARVLKHQGIVNLNFPLYLHGDPLCLSGQIDTIIDKFPMRYYNLISVTGYFDKTIQDYKGWRSCGFPDFLINGNTSFVVNVELKRNSFLYAKIQTKSTKIKKITTFRRVSMYGLKYFFWKCFSVFYRKISKKITKNRLNEY